MSFSPIISRRRKSIDLVMRRYTWGAIGGAAISVVGGLVAKNNSKKSAGAEVPYSEVDLQQQQKDALAGNLASQGSIEKLLGRANSFQQGQALSLTEQAMPGYQELSKTLTDRATTLAKNPYDVPQEVQQNLERLAAERGISAGTRGQFNDFSLLRDFGVNQLQYGRENLSQASSITSLLSSIAPRVNPMSPLSFYVSPEQNAANTRDNNQTRQSIAQSSSNANAAAANANSATWGNLISGATGIGAGLFENYMNKKSGGGGGVMVGNEGDA